MTSKQKTPDRPIMALRRTLKGWEPYAQYDQDAMERYRVGDVLYCYAVMPQDPKIRRKFKGAMYWLAQAKGTSLNQMQTIIMWKAGFGDSVEYHPGLGTTVSPPSTMDLDGGQMLELWNRTVEIIAREYLPHLTDAQIIAKVHRYIGISDGTDNQG